MFTTSALNDMAETNPYEPPTAEGSEPDEPRRLIGEKRHPFALTEMLLTPIGCFLALALIAFVVSIIAALLFPAVSGNALR
jgi:hypothetical protein